MSAVTKPDVKVTEIPNDLSSQDLDAIKLTGEERLRGFILFVICTAIAGFVFFTNITINGESQIVFGFIYNFFVDILGDFGYWVLTIIITGNLLLHIYSKYIDKGKKNPGLFSHYGNDTPVQTLLYAVGAFYVVLYTLHTTVPGFTGPEIVVGADTGGSVIPPIVLGVLWIILVGAVFMPFLINYGAIELIGAILEPFMRPLFKLPGKAALDATASFLSSSSLAVLITSRLYKQGVYTEREAVSVVTSFSAVSIGFAYLVIDTAGMSSHFPIIYITSFIIAFIIAMIMVRIPPVSKKSDYFYNGRLQTEKDRNSDTKLDAKIFSRGLDRAIKSAYIAKNIPKEIKNSLLDSIKVIPQVLTMLSAIGVTAMILAEYTPVFSWIGMVFQPIISVLGIPNAADIAPSMPIGIAEMFLPVLIIVNKLDVISIQARAFVCIVSMVQIIFFSETGTVILATKMPIKLSQLIICFVERTVIAMPLAAVAVHLFIK